ncbi:unnamed protein product [Cuscuta epithymum]|uniref:LRAT domain-containing protein n=1 Tax=Cuscuta epithymum TaxID=186058 RepID=A0AAV0DYK5_9ASTE|nr:unnamed protein product [Cuscuta epithymum]
MGFLSQRVERSELAAGDHIYTWRAGFVYAHHGIYVGGKKVVHFTATEGSTDATTRLFAVCTSSSICPTVCTNQDIPDCGFHKSSGVFLSCLDCFLGNGLLYRFEYGQRSLVLLAKLRGGTCTTAESDPPETVIRRAMDSFTTDLESMISLTGTVKILPNTVKQDTSSILQKLIKWLAD